MNTITNSFSGRDQLFHSLKEVKESLTKLNTIPLFTKYKILDTTAIDETLFDHSTDGQKLVTDTKRSLRKAIALIDHLSDNTLPKKQIKILHTNAQAILANFRQLNGLIYLISLDKAEKKRTLNVLTNSITLMEKTVKLIDDLEANTPGRGTKRKRETPSSTDEQESLILPPWPEERTIRAQVESYRDPVLKKFKKESSAPSTKLDNIKEMIAFTEVHQIPGVIVPAVMGIDSRTIEDFLRRQSPNFTAHWNTLCRDFPKEEEKQKTYLKQPDVQNILSEITKGIKIAFRNISSNLLSDEIQGWLARAAEDQNYLMVRSSGAEDGNGSVNAGGNISKSYVPPTPDAFFEAVGEVVCSYFSTTSLQNRINANENPFETDLKLSVASQILVGEDIDGAHDPLNIPVSIVLFSNEPLYVGNESFRVVTMVASYGHGEGVVNSIGIPKDTVYAFLSISHPGKMYIVYDNQEKSSRLVPINKNGQVALDNMVNPQAIATRRALSNAIIERLVSLGIMMESHFKYNAVDMEIVVKNDTIYPVQARPIYRPQSLPTYIEINPTVKGSTPELYMKVVLPGKASALTEISRNELLICSSLAEAENIYNPLIHKAIIFDIPEDKNSHPIVNFSSLGVPCFYIKDRNDVEQFLGQVETTKTLLLCPQKGCIYICSSHDQYEVKSGFIVHPATISHSLDIGTEIPPLRSYALDTSVVKLFQQLQAATTSEAANGALEALKTSPPLHRLRQRQDKLKEKMRGMKHPSRQATEISRIMNDLNTRTLYSIHEAQASLSNHSPHSLTSLFRQKLVSENFKSTEYNGVEKYDLMSSGPLYNVATRAIEYQSKLDAPAQFSYESLQGLRAPVEYLEHEWIDFLIKLESANISAAKIETFHQAIHVITKLGILPSWFLFSFSPIYRNTIKKDEKQVEECLDSLLESSHLDDPLLNDLCNKNQVLLDLLNTKGGFSNPLQFQQAFDKLKLLLQSITIDQLKQGLNHPSTLLQITTLQVMNRLVSVFDNSIKELKASPEYSTELKIECFKQMVQRYMDLFESWHIGLVDPNQKMIKGTQVVDEMSNNFSGYMTKSRQIFVDSAQKGPNTLKPSEGFSVEGAIFYNDVAFDRHLPVTLEDLFTLFHQNLLSSTGILNRKIILRNIKTIDAGITKYHDEMLTLLSALEIITQAIFVNQSGIEFNYSVPLRNHGLNIQLKFKQEGGIEITPVLVSNHPWEKYRRALELPKEFNLLQYSKNPTISGDITSCTWQIWNSSSFTFAVQLVQSIAASTLSENETIEMISRLFKPMLLKKYADRNTLIETVQLILEKSDYSPFFSQKIIEKILLDEKLISSLSLQEAVKLLLSFSILGENQYLERLIQIWGDNVHHSTSKSSFDVQLESALQKIYHKQDESNQNIADILTGLWKEKIKSRRFSIERHLSEILQLGIKIPQMNELILLNGEKYTLDDQLNAFFAFQMYAELYKLTYKDYHEFLNRLVKKSKTLQEKEAFLKHKDLQNNLYEFFRNTMYKFPSPEFLSLIDLLGGDRFDTLELIQYLLKLRSSNPHFNLIMIQLLHRYPTNEPSKKEEFKKIYDTLPKDTQNQFEYKFVDFTPEGLHNFIFSDFPPLNEDF